MNRLGKFGLVVITTFFLVALLAPWLAPYDPREQLQDGRNLPTEERLRPSGKNQMGRDDLGRDVLSRMVHGARISMRVGVTVVLISALVAIPLGVTAGRHQGTWIDNVAPVVALLGISTPGFVLGPLMVYLFALKLNLFPVSGRGGLEYLILPAVTMGLALAAILTRMVRSSVIEELSEDYVRTARAKGLSENRVIYRHVLKNGLIPVVTVIGLQFGVLLAGAIITETIF